MFVGATDKGAHDRGRGTVVRRLPNVPSLTRDVPRIVRTIGVLYEETGRNFENPRVRNVRSQHVDFVLDRSFAFAWRLPVPYNTYTYYTSAKRFV